MTTKTNRQVIIDAMAEIEELAALLTDMPDDFDESQRFAMDGICNRMIDRTSRIRFRIGRMQDGEA